jgi:zinc D-Ala-D-Ala carboxypeptidase
MYGCSKRGWKNKAKQKRQRDGSGSNWFAYCVDRLGSWLVGEDDYGVGKSQGPVVQFGAGEGRAEGDVKGVCRRNPRVENLVGEEGHVMLKYFKLHEFDSPDLPGSGDMMEREFLEMLDNAREFAGFPFIVTSGFRSVPHNKSVGGVRNSSHLLGWAADIAVTSSRKRFMIVDALLEAGFTRIGIGEDFVHCDCDPEKPKGRIWTY